MDTPDLADLKAQLEHAERDAQSLAAELTPEEGAWRPGEGTWSIAQCLDHLVRTNERYLHAMREAAEQGRRDGMFRRRPAVPGPLGRWIAEKAEPPVVARLRIKAPHVIEPDATVPVGSALEDFRRSQGDVRRFLDTFGDLDLARIRFRNPFVRGLRFRIATGLHILTAHERRHLWQARNVRDAAVSRGR